MPGRGRFKDIDVWPEPDRTLWRRGLSPASLLDRTGHAVKWRPATVSKVGRGYASFLHWLDLSGLLSADEGPEQRTTPERIEAYCAYLGGKVRPTTIYSRLIDVVRALSVLAPGMDTGFIRKRSYCYPKRGDRLAKRARMNAWPELLVPYLLQYLDVYRPLLLAGRYDGNHLWVSQRPGPLTDNGIYYAITTRTKAAFGDRVNPHLFRDCAATSLAIHDPANVQLARHALGHAHYRTTQDFYNQARSVEASESLNEAMQKRRQRPRARKMDQHR
jgi:integrase